MGFCTELPLKIAAGSPQGEKSMKEQEKRLKMEATDILDLILEVTSFYSISSKFRIII